jgi:hypothetical protein
LSEIAAGHGAVLHVPSDVYLPRGEAQMKLPWFVAPVLFIDGCVLINYGVQNCLGAVSVVVALLLVWDEVRPMINKLLQPKYKEKQ